MTGIATSVNGLFKTGKAVIVNIMYILDYKTKKVKRFTLSELSYFLNSNYNKNRYIFFSNKEHLIKSIYYCKLDYK
jgi:hypothetical protein